MAQRDKVKELVGRGLDSYHTKSLQQMDRIEKKNKEQNHKISILSNELDNDYLTKTEEGSVVSLEHSKEGMIYLDELQGNTLVNYCTDGSKEITLNGDIDVEGTFVTTTEGVDNGKVDVMCEGNTLVNKLYKIKNYGSSTEFKKHGWSSGAVNCKKYEWLDNGIKIYSTLEDTSTDRYYRSTPDKYGIFKKNRTYIVRMNVNSNDFGVNAAILRCFYGNGRTFMSGALSDVKNGVFVKKATTSSEIEERDAIHSMISLDYIRPLNTEGWVSFQNVMVIDVTDLPSYQQDVEYWRNIEYFEGMKSVGQDDENGHKIEILSRNDNLFVPTQHIPNGWSSGNMIVSNNYRSYWIKCKPNTTYFVESDRSGNRFGVCCSDRIELNGVAFPVTKGGIFGSTDDTNKVQSTIFTTDASAKYLYVYTINNGVFPTPKIMISEGSSVKTYIEPKLNKKEILLNEPLRGLPNGVKDKFVKIGGKWFIERNCRGKIITKDTTKFRLTQVTTTTNLGIGLVIDKTLELADCFKTPGDLFLLEGFVNGKSGQWYEKHWGAYANSMNIVAVFPPTYTLDQMIDFIDGKQIVYKLETPTYEPLEINPELITYLDTNHISNNSLIPCNMKVQNSGYNAIIKPSTLYTVALDTNKSGTIGMNLGGAKGTTTNNVLTLTTPATLTDDSLRIYGKGIKGSKVRLLEGDKTNWIPSYFEGMKSSFEDKFDTTDNTYKMEILSNKGGMNLCINSDDIRGGVASGIILEKVDDKGYKNVAKLSGDLSGSWFSVSSTLATKISPNTTITISVLARTDKPNNQSKLSFYLGDGQEGSYINFNEPLSNEYKWVSQTRKFISNSFRPHFGLSYFNGYSVYISKMKIEFGNKMTEWCPSIKDASWSEYENYNKIQFSSIEPLRKWDRFVFKDDKLMIERNTRVHIINDKTQYIDIATHGNKIKTIAFKVPVSKIGENDVLLCKDFPNAYVWSEFEHCHTNQNIINITINRSRLSTQDVQGFTNWLKNNSLTIYSKALEPTYEEIPFELQKIILEGYENGTLFFDTNIPPTSTITYAGETPIVKATKLNKTEVLNNTTDINDNIIPYLMDMDYRVVCLELATETQGISMARLFGGVYEMLKRDILSGRLSKEEYGYRLADYFNAGKLTEEQVRELEDLR